uniref:Uncharacterized protein n=1 Tax=Nephroselmis olivacea TaxID=31312 RepID=Q9T3F9_NEPOL|nr:hypothetical protein NeolCp102 [Nephroselmis olivacea]NP_050940.1 hypothetical protein NeolCp135 [Nephroselmis olivacea]AAD54878.1 unknown [Nephroselmis olivacea]AAD54911.1 unknown [Nephroselmis olivacea]
MTSLLIENCNHVIFQQRHDGTNWASISTQELLNILECQCGRLKCTKQAINRPRKKVTKLHNKCYRPISPRTCHLTLHHIRRQNQCKIYTTSINHVSNKIPKQQQTIFYPRYSY